MEQAVQSSQRKAFDLQERDRENLLKVKNDLRNTGDSQSTVLADVQTKIANIEGQIQREEQIRNELRDKLRVSEEANT